MWRIEPVPARRRMEALRFLVGPASAGPWGPRQARGQGPGQAGSTCEAQAIALFSLAEGPPRASLWWAWDRCCAAAAMVVEQPGRTGFLLAPPAGAPGMEGPALAEVVRATTREALEKGLYFVQVSIPADTPPSSQPAAWGYEFVAELIYMSLELPSYRAAPAGEELSWRSYGPPFGRQGFSEGELGELILATYEGSLDCPLLLRLRKAADTIASHRTAGQFRPQSWWVVGAREPLGSDGEGQGPGPDSGRALQPDSGQAPRWDSGQAAGCVLANDRPLESAAEVVYLGVRPQCRGKGLARRLLDRAAGDASRRGLRKLLLAVDSRNAPALRIYRRAGFQLTHRKHIWASIGHVC